MAPPAFSPPGGQVVESLVREPAWPCPPSMLIDFFCPVLGGTLPNPSGSAEHLPHTAFLAAAYASAITKRSADPKAYWYERLTGPVRRSPDHHWPGPALRMAADHRG
ncbi:hypothetical protein [Streptomyces sp. NPDC000405]|uniref:hypothetical protein n=1 Tax=Streptomyces sp. NPDC000405 TaxID=3161033 RepID=UPI00398C8F2E